MSSKRKKELTVVSKQKKGVYYYLKKLYEHVTFYNSMAPFPIYDTEYVEKINSKIKKMGHLKDKYDELPVYFCKHCKSLHIELDDKQNNVCHRCGSVNEVDVLPNIESYTKKYGKIWE